MHRGGARPAHACVVYQHPHHRGREPSEWKCSAIEIEYGSGRFGIQASMAGESFDDCPVDNA